MTDPLQQIASRSRHTWIAASVMLTMLAWTFGSVLATLAGRWSSDPSYSHGYIVPVIAGVIAWLRIRDSSDLFRSTWLGFLPLFAGLALHVASGMYYYEWSDAIAIIPCVAGVVMLAGGVKLLKVTWPAVLFLAFMVPLPYRIESALSGPLQSVATFASTFVIQVCGFPASSQGNTIRIESITVGVAEACSGLRMLVVFFAISTALAILSRRTLLEKFVITFSAPAIAVACNVIRISATGMLLATSHSELAHAVYHDLAGWLMMPLALGMLFLELKFLDRLVVEATPGASPKALSRHVHVPAPMPVSNTHGVELLTPSTSSRL